MANIEKKYIYGGSGLLALALCGTTYGAYTLGARSSETNNTPPNPESTESDPNSSAVLITATPMPTIPPTSTPTFVPTETPHVFVFPPTATVTQVAPTPTTAPTIEPLTITPATDFGIRPNQTWSGQTEYNQMRTGTVEEKAIAERFFDHLIAQAGEANSDPNSLQGTSATITAFLNPFLGPNYDAVHKPENETGMQVTINILQHAKDNGYVYDILTGDIDVKVNELMQPIPGTNLKVGIFWGPAHDRDAIMAILAAGIDHTYWGKVNPSEQTNGKVADLLNDRHFADHVNTWQNIILANTQDHSLPLSKSEINRRAASSPLDASTLINPTLNESDQSAVCEEMLAFDQYRVFQNQIWPGVGHVSGGAQTLKQADTEKEFYIYAAVFDTLTGKWDAMAINTRGFTGDPIHPAGNTIYAVAGNEMLPCGTREIIPGTTITPDQVVTPTGPAFIPTVSIPPTEETETPESKKGDDPHDDSNRTDRGDKDNDEDDGDDKTIPGQP